MKKSFLVLSVFGVVAVYEPAHAMLRGAARVAGAAARAGGAAGVMRFAARDERSVVRLARQVERVSLTDRPVLVQHTAVASPMPVYDCSCGQKFSEGLESIQEEYLRGYIEDTLGLQAKSGNLNEDYLRGCIEAFLFLQAKNGNRNAEKLFNLFLKKGHKVTILDAAFYGNNDVAHILLFLNSADLGVADSRGMTALHYAAKNGNEELVEMLLDAEANPFATTDDGKTPLDFAKTSNGIRMLEKAMAARAADSSK